MTRPEFGIQIGDLALHEASFRRIGPDPDDQPSEIPIQVSLGVAPIEDDSRVRVLFTSTIRVEGWFEVRASYTTLFHKVRSFPEELVGLESPWATVVAQLAPRTLYPYCRETVTGLLTKARIQIPSPPILDFASLISPEDIVFPERAPSA